ncbi:WD40 repeat protein [Umbelopsis nana]
MHTKLFTTMPRVVLSHVERSAAHVRDFGKNISLIWKPDATSFVAITDKQYLLLYVILPFENASFQLNSPQSAHGYTHGPGEGKGPKTMLIRFRLAIRIDAGIACGTTSDDSLIITTLKPAAVQRVSWNPQEVNQTGTNMVSKMWWLGQNNSIVAMNYNKAMNISVWITSDGHAFFVKCHKSLSRSRRGSKETAEPSSPTAKSPVTPKERQSIDESKGAKGRDHDESASNITPTMPSFSVQSSWQGLCFHTGNEHLLDSHRATSISINARFSLIAIGTRGGDIFVYSAQSYTSTPAFSHKLELPPSRQWSPTTNASKAQSSNGVTSISWTTDGYALAAGYDGRGFAVWSVYGHLLCSSETAEDTTSAAARNVSENVPFRDAFSHGVDSIFWGAGNTTLFLLAKDNSATETSPDPSAPICTKFYSLPFAKSAVALMHSPDNARNGLLQMDDRLLLYNGGDHQESSATIDPDSISWSHISLPTMYISEHWPIRYASIDSEGKWIAVAGKRGLAHYSTVSGRWKMFGNQQQEQEFHVRGGMVWFRHVLIAACELPSGLSGRHHVLRFYSRETNLDNAHMLYQISLKHPVIYMSVTGSYLILYTSDNVLSIYHLTTGFENGSGLFHGEVVRHITLSGVVTQVARVRSITLLGSDSNCQIGSATDLMNARLVLLVDGKLIILSPNADENEEDGRRDVHYELDVLTEKTEYYWVNSKPLGNLHTSIWAVDGKGIRVFTNLITGGEDECDNVTREPILPPEEDEQEDPPANADGNRPYSLRGLPSGHVASAPYFTDDVKRWRTPDVKAVTEQAAYIPLDFYPLSVLLKKGIIVGIEQNITLQATLGLLQFRLITKTHLFLHHIFRNLLSHGYEADAVLFAKKFEKLVYFGHALEILLHTVLEKEADSPNRHASDAILPIVIQFLDQFPHALDVIVGCARKTEVALWEHLFSIVGNPQDLFELCLKEDRLKTATSYLIIIQTLEPLSVASRDTIRLLQMAMDAGNYELGKELVRFLNSIDHTGKTLREAMMAIQPPSNSSMI